MIEFDGDNSFPGCRRCGRCCEIGVLCMAEDEFRTITSYMEENGVQPHDHGFARCCFQNDDHTCMIWPARPQVCRLYSCQAPRMQILRENPSIEVPDDPHLVCLRDAFVLGDLSDPNERTEAPHLG